MTTTCGLRMGIAILWCLSHPGAADPLWSQSVPTRKSDRIVLGAYGDTRTGPYGLGTNRRQRIHEAVVKNLLQNQDLDAVIFTGDAVMTNFPPTASRYWGDFIKITNRIVKERKILLFPSLGNHETYTTTPAITDHTPYAQPALLDASGSRENLSASITAAYNQGELAASVGPRTSIAKREKDAQRFVSGWMKDLEGGSFARRMAAAQEYGGFEGAIQREFYALPVDTRCAKDGEIFRKAYSERAHYEYLKAPTAEWGRSYYSQVIQAGDLKIKLIALDTNCLDSKSQQDFFRAEIANFGGRIVVFGHHPPITDDAKKEGAADWDAPAGWPEFRPYFSSAEGKKIVLWIFGHVHDYQRRSTTSARIVPSPVLMIAGGGGASLDSSPPKYQWQPKDWDGNFISVSAYHYVKLTLTSGGVDVAVVGASDPSQPFASLDDFHVDLE